MLQELCIWIKIPTIDIDCIDLYQNVSYQLFIINTFSLQKVNSPLLSEEELTENLRKLLSKLIDKETLNLFGWPDESVDVVCVFK